MSKECFECGATFTDDEIDQCSVCGEMICVDCGDFHDELHEEEEETDDE